jgi:hypothetical protein
MCVDGWDDDSDADDELKVVAPRRREHVIKTTGTRMVLPWVT